MRSGRPDTFWERIFFALLGLATGAFYGLMLAGIIYAFTGRFPSAAVSWSAYGFAALGGVYGNVVGEAFIGTLHFIWGLMQGVTFTAPAGEDLDKPKHLHALMLLGLMTGLIIVIVYL